tara:strand:- start:18 stop:374 length:357 start_codon:yes stop_codon:yes gene_type:complete
MNLQLKAIDYLEETYGKNYEKKNLNLPSITNAYMQGFRDKEGEEKTAKVLAVSHKRYEWFKKVIPNKEEKEFDKVMGNIGNFFGIMIEKNKHMTDNIGAVLDGEGGVLSFIDFEEIKK